MMKLKKYLLDRGIKFCHFADQIGMSKNNLNNILNGKNLPSLMMAYTIDKKTRGYVTAYDWIDDHKRVKDEKQED